MHKFIRSLAGLLAGLVAATNLLAANPDLSGTWVLNTDKGQNLGMMKAVSQTAVIAQTPEKVVIDFAATFMMKTTERKVTFDLAGKPVNNEGPMGDHADTVAKWDNGKLVVTWTTEGAVAGSKVVKTETYSLGPDGKTMTVENSRAGKDTIVMVYDRKASEKK